MIVRNWMRRRAALVACLVAMIAVGPTAARAQESVSSEGGLGAAAALCTLLYGPVKVVYAAGGLVFGSLAWLFSGGDGDVGRAVITPAVRGDYVVTPSHLRGERTLEFFGRDPAYRTQPAVIEQTY